MASGDSGVQETCLDEVEVDDDGNVVPSSKEIAYMDQSDEETAVDADAVEVDEDGNLRIQSASRLLSEMDPDPDEADSRAEERRRNFRQKLSEHGTAEEETEMLAMDALQGGEVNDRHSRGSEQDLQSIELTVIDQAPEQAEESHWPAASVDNLERGDTSTGNERRKRKGVGRVMDMAGSQLSSISPERAAIIIAVVIVFVGICLTASLLPASFVYVEYYELALAKNKITGSVNREDVYYPGCHLLTPEVELIRFKGTAHVVQKTMKIVTSDRLMFDLGITMQYFIKPEELGQLFTDYAQDYSRVVEAKIQSSIHNAGSGFTLEQIRLNRTHVEHILKEAVALKLTGNCCPTCCPFDCGKSADCRTCVLEGRGCTKGIHMELRYFQMGAVDIPEDVSERFLKQILLLVEAEKEMFVQQHALETKKSEELQKEILNRASEVREAAMAQAQTIQSVAEAEYDKQVQTSYAAAWKKVYQRLNITQEDHKLSIMYIRALDDISDHLFNLNYDKLTTSD